MTKRESAIYKLVFAPKNITVYDFCTNGVKYTKKGNCTFPGVLECFLGRSDFNYKNREQSLEASQCFKRIISFS
jgi:hypothetical protein